jgi:hypothetical protein
MATEPRTDDRSGILDGIRVDVVRLHETWMELLFPRQRGASHSVLGKWQPSTTGDRVKYRLWSALGVLIVAIGYPLALLGFAARFYSRRIDSGATRLGAIGVLVLSALVWGALTLAARIQFGPASQGFFAVAAASVVAVISAVLAYGFTKLDGRPVTVLFAYPAAMTAIFLPPVVAALFSPTVADAVLPGSENLAIFLLDNVAPDRVAAYLRANFDLRGAMYLVMWFGIAVPLGWLLGILVTLADVVRPTDGE